MDKLFSLKNDVKIYRAFDIRTDIGAVIATVFDTLTTAKGLNSWWTDSARADCREGGEVEYIWEMGTQSTIGKARYRKFQLPHFFEVEYEEWNDETDFQLSMAKQAYAQPIAHRFELEELPGRKTAVQLCCSGMKFGADYDEFYEATYQDWKNSLANFKSVCEKGIDLRHELKAFTPRAKMKLVLKTDLYK
jgi:uncharacterized protein YndB with AHSA1/START domain